MDLKVGVRELRQNLSEYLRAVSKGARFTITDHNVPVAKLLPLAAEREETWEEKKRRLKIREAKGDPLSIWDLEPVKLPDDPDAPSMEEILAEIREDRL